MLFPSANGQKSWLLAILTLIVGLHLYFHFTIPEPVERRGQWVDQSIAQVLWPLHRTFEWMKFVATSGASSVRKLSQAADENEQLKGLLRQQELELSQLNEVLAENKRLRDLVGFLDR